MSDAPLVLEKTNSSRRGSQSKTKKYRRDVHGILLLDKPTGLSSNDALQRVKTLFCAKKAGHTGALDPLATGMLPICLGEATKFSGYLLDADKRYRVVARLGQRTDTSDSDGKIIQERPIGFSKSQFDSALDCFRGETKQVPSMYSALKYQGKPLYEYARKNIEVPRQARTIHVYELTLVRQTDHELELEIHCSKGTYIRTIIDDLGEKLGCGAHVIMLRRLQVAHYPVDKMLTLDQLYSLKKEDNDRITSDQNMATICNKNEALEEKGQPVLTEEGAMSLDEDQQRYMARLDALLMPLDSPTLIYPEINLTSNIAHYFKQGQPIIADTKLISGLVRVTEGARNLFIGMAEIDNQGRVAPRRLISPI